MQPSPQARLVHRETVTLCLLVLIAIGAFFLTRTIARANEARRIRDARVWSERGRGSLAAGAASTAAQQLRRAVALDPQDIHARLTLASALITQGADDEARLVLRQAQDAAPHHADVSLALGRLESREGSIEPAIEAYQSALADLWRPTDATARYQVRSELAQYLLRRGAVDRALPEILFVSAEVPDTATAHADVGAMFLAAGEPARALTQLERALTLSPSDADVRLKAGQAAIALGQDRRALQHLRVAEALPAARDLATVIALVLAHDPLLPRLSAAERERRLRGILSLAHARLDACDSDAGSQETRAQLRQELDEMTGALATAARRRTPVVDLVDDAVGIVARMERQTESCGAVTPLDRALRLIGARHEARS
jgi:Tfp pilus assembly protein PilF